MVKVEEAVGTTGAETDKATFLGGVYGVGEVFFIFLFFFLIYYLNLMQLQYWVQQKGCKEKIYT
jgi:hypothetical protein